ncbi:class II SORL domain-containing protein [Nitratiruptor sp. SB155-2]|uniref:class II SORL domain-containing protein n=1 Tax=Nitratiruptor sp. (strain SB155-2) TaxID=387092 RepID=UPI0002FA2419|nr:class II SORL domain-containing protein [Nitratiruptor sp. SB155-2]
MPTINRYVDISEIDREAKKDYIDRHSPFVICDSTAKKGEKFQVKVRVGNEYSHPDDFDHYIAYVQLWDGERLLGQATFTPGTLANEKSQVEVDFYIIPTKKLKLTAMSYCTKHGLWESTPVEVEVTE